MLSLQPLLDKLTIDDGLEVGKLDEEEKAVLQNLVNAYENIKDSIDNSGIKVDKLSGLLNVKKDELISLFSLFQFPYTNDNFYTCGKDVLDFYFAAIKNNIENKYRTSFIPGIDNL